MQKSATYAAKSFQLLGGGFAPRSPDQGLCPWTLLGAQPPYAHHNGPKSVERGAAVSRSGSLGLAESDSAGAELGAGDRRAMSGLHRKRFERWAVTTYFADHAWLRRSAAVYHCIRVYSEVSRILLMRNLTKKFTERTNEQTTLFMGTHLDYCTAAWSLHNIKDIVLLERIQIRFQEWLRDWRICSAKNLQNWNCRTWKSTCAADQLKSKSLILLRGLSSIKLETFFEVDLFDNTGITIIRGH